MRIKDAQKLITLELLANTAVLFSVVIAFALLGYNYAIRRHTPNLSVGLAKGEVLPRLTDYAAYPRTLILILNTECAHCETSAGFYNRLILSSNQKPNHVRIVGVFPNDLALVKRFLTRNSLQLEVVPNTDLDRLKIGGTPSLILVNSNGEITDFWIGKLSQQQEEEVVASIFHL